MTVDAAPEAVKKYIHMGMKPIDEMQMIHGKCYVPMAMEILKQNDYKKRSKQFKNVAQCQLTKNVIYERIKKDMVLNL